jgi:dihydrofolate reductase
MTKVVFSGSSKESDWENTQIHHEHLIEVVRELKQRSRTDILVLGSGTIVQQLASERLIDEYIFIVIPVVAGEGKPSFLNVKQFELTLFEVKTFQTGNILLHYVLKK